MRVGRKCEIKPIYSLEATKSPDVRAPIKTGVILIRRINTWEGGQEVTRGFCWTLLWTEKRSAGRLEAGSQFKPRRRRQVDIMLCQISGPEPAAPLPPLFLFSACKCTYCMCSHSPQNVHVPDHPEGFCTLLTFASFRRVLVWLINLAQ